jgi:hypothetical protein
MLSPVEQPDQQQGMIQVDHEILDSMRKSWLIPRGTGRLTSPAIQYSTFNEGNTPQPQLKNKNSDTP